LQKLYRIILIPLATSVLLADGDDRTSEILNKYLAAQELQRDSQRGVQMNVEMKASIPKLALSGTMRALRGISKLGKVSYDALNFDGDNTVKNQVISRYLTSEAQAIESPDPGLVVNPNNYKFKYKGVQNKDGRDVHVLELNPRKKRVGLFKGEIWLDPQTYLTVRESGKFVKSPSVFLKKVEFVREFEVRDGVAVPTKMTSYADTRLVGRTELDINYTNFSKQPEHATEATTSGIR
jgi:hypothetical protein